MIKMRFLKLFLWIILTTCVAWGSAIVLGPTLISRALNAAFAGSVEFNRLDVTPKLEVTASFVKFDIPANKGSIPLRGVVRGIDFSWRMVDNIALIATLGPSHIEGVGALESAKIKFAPRGLLDWKSADLVAVLSSVKAGYSTAGEVKITVGLNDNLGTLKATRVTAQDVKIERGDLTAEEFILDFSDLELRYPIEQQDIPFNLDISGSLAGAGRHVSGVNLSGELRSPSVVFDILVEKAKFDDFEVVVDGFSASSSYDLSSKQLGPVSRISAARITSESVRMNIVDYLGEIHFDENKILTKGSMNVKSLVLKSGSTSLANISNAELRYEGSIPKKADKEYPLTVDAKLQITDNLSVVSSLDALLLSDNLTGCNANNCAIVNSSIRYTVELPSAKLTGESYCEVGICLPDQMRHSVTTDNTDVFFAELADERILSPLIVPLAYYAVRGSSPIGFGHSLDF
ncbi:hypothetical protein N9370_01815 [Paracoccaceae bacterium]|nr:hypothetical protein [Paracoccaceae bacterium]